MKYVFIHTTSLITTHFIIFQFFLQELQYLFLDYNLLPVDDTLKSFLRTFPSLKYCSLSGNLHVSHRTTVNGVSGSEELKLAVFKCIRFILLFIFNLKLMVLLLFLQEIITDENTAGYNNTPIDNSFIPNVFSQSSLPQSIRREDENNINYTPVEGIRLTENIADQGDGAVGTDTDVDTDEDDAENSESGESEDMKTVYRQSHDVNNQENDNTRNDYDSTGNGSLLDEETTFTGQVNTGELLSYLSDDDDDDVEDADQSPHRDLDDPSAAYSENGMRIKNEMQSKKLRIPLY